VKIAILGFTKIKYMPYLRFYLDQIDTAKNEVSLLYWERDKNPDIPFPPGVRCYAFEYPMSDALPLRKKLPGILKYGRYAKSIIKKTRPDFLVILHSTTGISIYRLLTGKYKGKYIFDYRDATYERFEVYGKMVRTIAERAALCFTSSDGFRKYLPTDPRPLNSHNITDVSFREEMASLLPRKKHTPVRLAYWGLLRNQKINEAMIEKLGGDSRFEVHYYGRAQGSMLRLMEESTQKYGNVFFHGEYKPEDRLEMAKNTDIIHNIFDLNDKTMPIAMSNKYYDGPLFGLPQLCTKGSHMGALVTKYGIGLECTPFEADFADQVYQYYTELDEKAFLAHCDKELSRVLSEVEFGNQKIKEVLRNA